MSETTWQPNGLGFSIDNSVVGGPGGFVAIAQPRLIGGVAVTNEYFNLQNPGDRGIPEVPAVSTVVFHPASS